MSRSYNTSEELLERACKTIPLGSQTFSKSKTQFPHGASPYFADRANGASLWDVDGNQYIDFLNGLLAITLGYNDPDVTSAVQDQLNKGTLFSLATELEVTVAEKMCKLIPCADMVRFGKNGSDATAGAIRLARAFTKRDHVLVCGYHGWQDWYIGSTSRNLGVPKATQELTHSFTYNDIDSLTAKLNELKGQVAAVILEPAGFDIPRDNFLEQVKAEAHNHDALLIFDETITGFRYSMGGAQEFYKVTPDLATFGKGLANGFPLSAVTGKAEIMQLMEEIFFSFTFGGETLSLAAANAVLQKLESAPVIKKIHETGKGLLVRLNSLISEQKLNQIFSTSGEACWSFLRINNFNEHSSWDIRTLFIQEMFTHGIINIGTHNLSYAHGQKEVDALMSAYEAFFNKLNEAIKDGNLLSRIKGERLTPLFKVR